MTICLTGHVYEVFPKKYGGVERVVGWWAEELKRLGHRVILIAPATSNANVDRIIPPLESDGERFADAIYNCDEKLDVVHDNNDYGTPSEKRWLRNPYVFTVHACVKPPVPNPIFLSYNQARWYGYGDSKKHIVIHNGLPVDNYTWNDEYHKDDYLVWCGSLRGGKAPEMAVKLARETGHKLVIIGPIQDSKYADFGKYTGGADGITYVGELGEERLEYFRRAKAFIYTCDESWMEGFNLVNIEALLSGTPVIGLKTKNNTIVDEQIVEGKSGFICDSYGKMLDVVIHRKYEELKPEIVRRHGEMFDVKKTVQQYLSAYALTMAGFKWE